MENPIVNEFLKNGLMKANSKTIETSWELSELIFKAMDKAKMKAVFHFNKEDGTLVFEKVLGRDENYDFYNEKNGNLEQRKEEIKRVIVTALLNKYNNIITASKKS